MRLGSHPKYKLASDQNTNNLSPCSNQQLSHFHLFFSPPLLETSVQSSEPKVCFYVVLSVVLFCIPHMSEITS